MKAVPAELLMPDVSLELGREEGGVAGPLLPPDDGLGPKFNATSQQK